MATTPISRWAWAVVAIVVLMGGALLTTVWTTYESVRDASAILLRGEANALQQAVRADLADLDRVPSQADLAAVLEAHRDEGLRYIAAVGHGYVAEAGAAVLGPPLPMRMREPLIAEGRMRVQLFGGPWRLERPRLPPVILEIEPVQAEALRRAAIRTLGVGSIAASMLLVVALVLLRWAILREARERRLEHERRLASLGEVSAVLAHEIRNPLASLKGNAQLLAGMLSGDDKTRQKADRVVEEAVRLEMLTNDLLDYVRTGDIRRERVDPGALLRDAAASIDDERIEVDGAAAPATWPLDAERMRQVLTNILDNAVQAGPPVRASVVEADGQLVFEVRDAGPGVPPEDQERIFEPFYTRRTRGTGLGLAVAKRVVELHRGTITVANAPGGGAVFRVALPSA